MDIVWRVMLVRGQLDNSVRSCMPSVKLVGRSLKNLWTVASRRGALHSEVTLMYKCVHLRCINCSNNLVTISSVIARVQC
jgi:hypothetical protein